MITIDDGMGFSVFHAQSEEVLFISAEKGLLVVKTEEGKILKKKAWVWR